MSTVFYGAVNTGFSGDVSIGFYREVNTGFSGEVNIVFSEEVITGFCATIRPSLQSRDTLSGLHPLSFPLTHIQSYWKSLKIGESLGNVIQKGFLEGLYTVWRTGIFVPRPAAATTAFWRHGASWKGLDGVRMYAHCEIGVKPQQGPLKAWFPCRGGEGMLRWDVRKKKNRTYKNLKSWSSHIGLSNKYLE